MRQDRSGEMVMFVIAKWRADYWKEFQAGVHTLVLARYKARPTDRRSRYSLFLFLEKAKEPELCFSFEPDDFEGQEPVAFFGEWRKDTHANYGEAPNDMTIGQFQAIAFERVAKRLDINVQDIVLRDQFVRYCEACGAKLSFLDRLRGQTHCRQHR